MKLSEFSLQRIINHKILIGESIFSSLIPIRRILCMNTVRLPKVLWVLECAESENDTKSAFGLFKNTPIYPGLPTVGPNY